MTEWNETIPATWYTGRNNPLRQKSCLPHNGLLNG